MNTEVSWDWESCRRWHSYRRASFPLNELLTRHHERDGNLAFQCGFGAGGGRVLTHSWQGRSQNGTKNAFWVCQHFCCASSAFSIFLTVGQYPHSEVLVLPLRPNFGDISRWSMINSLQHSNTRGWCMVVLPNATMKTVVSFSFFMVRERFCNDFCIGRIHFDSTICSVCVSSMQKVSQSEV